MLFRIYTFQSKYIKYEEIGANTNQRERESYQYFWILTGNYESVLGVSSYYNPEVILEKFDIFDKTPQRVL